MTECRVPGSVRRPREAPGPREGQTELRPQRRPPSPLASPVATPVGSPLWALCAALRRLGREKGTSHVSKTADHGQAAWKGSAGNATPEGAAWEGGASSGPRWAVPSTGLSAHLPPAGARLNATFLSKCQAESELMTLGQEGRVVCTPRPPGGRSNHTMPHKRRPRGACGAFPTGAGSLGERQSLPGLGAQVAGSTQGDARSLGKQLPDNSGP